MEPSESQTSFVNWSAALEATGGDPELLDEVVGAFLEESPMRMNQIRQGLETPDSSLVRIGAHTLKGLLRIFEVERCVELAHRIERLGQQNDLKDVREILDDLETLMALVTVELQKHLNP